ncbi:Peptidyl-prolyl cis-trans isomerase d-like protein, related [Eimeria tenella]|uniref:Peptidyl-prolyl cis-trans isomerase d-like protein, related n=1 Tax=Eimeria tenella TaxID=5802 RepID=U6KMN2_EIMTE|nr:Peptidyl-prolyl cis-trans isomerase d-like protein, related [Eimeria tenella]CDJ39362.1 Peptidyl-prolyl cis-trans isomerase d-like protein, related [Eimeria tenella]|eukprot:XP_013230117.1 Peptidyl-prolyl cis-trans isomerase d-like protein, related [Eimeria tenella]
MAMHECEAYWQDFLRRPNEQRMLQEEQRQLQKETACRMAAVKSTKLEELETALAGCTPDQQRILRPIIQSPGLLERLHDCLLRSDHNPGIFSKRIETDQSLAALILEKAEEYERHPEAFKRQEQQLKEIHEEASRPLDAADLDYLKQRTWRDLPQAELAERMSKGEICPRDEWIPGISKGKRPLDAPALEEHLSFGERLAREGREAYATGDYDKAFMRFKQGVELVNWVEAKDAVSQRRIDDMYSLFLKNSAQAALQLGKYQEAIRACTTIIQELDEHDSKARYRRGRAYLLLGMTKCAKDDFMFILKSPYSTQEGVCAARLGLQELRQVLNKSETEAKLTVCRGLEGSLFSRGRLAAAHVRQLGAADDPDKSDDDQFHFSRNYPEDKTDFHLPPSKTTAEAANSCNSADGQGVESISKAATCDEAETQDKHTEYTKKGETQELPPLSLAKTRSILLDFLDAYTSDPVAAELNALRSLADFDYRRVILRARKYLPQVQQPILARHGIVGDDHRSNMKLVEKGVSYWRFKSPEIEELTKDCLQAVFGDVADIDV